MLIKSYFNIMVALLITGVILSSCKKDDDDDNNRNAYYMRCKVDGQPWEAQTTGFWAAALETSFIPGLTGYGTDNVSQLTFNFDSDTADEKSFYFSRWAAGGTGFDDTIFCSYSPQFFANPGANYYVARTGVLTIADINWTDSVATGTFSFTAEHADNPADLTQITDGEFRVPVTRN